MYIGTYIRGGGERWGGGEGREEEYSYGTSYTVHEHIQYVHMFEYILHTYEEERCGGYLFIHLSYVHTFVLYSHRQKNRRLYQKVRD
jgi:hypothetical protein